MKALGVELSWRERAVTSYQGFSSEVCAEVKSRYREGEKFPGARESTCKGSIQSSAVRL